MNASRRQFLAGILAAGGLMLTNVPLLGRRLPKMEIEWLILQDMHGQNGLSAEPIVSRLFIEGLDPNRVTVVESLPPEMLAVIEHEKQEIIAEYGGLKPRKNTNALLTRSNPSA